MCVKNLGENGPSIVLGSNFEGKSMRALHLHRRYVLSTGTRQSVLVEYGTP